MKSNTRIKTVIFLIFSGLFLMQDKLQEWFAPFQYFDETFGLLLFPMVFLRWYQKRLHPIREKGDWLFYAGLAIFWIFGWAGYLYYRYQPLSNALKDFYVNCKFFFALGASYLFFDDENLDFEQMKEKIWPVLGGVTVLLFAESGGASNEMDSDPAWADTGQFGTPIYRMSNGRVAVCTGRR